MPPRVETHCVYILRSLKSPTRSYVGYTSDPYNRLRQHNGEVKGGARKTRLHRPWEMLAVISRFSSHTSALQFEWALQHPAASLAVRASVRGKPGLGTARSVKSKFAVADMMTRLEQWSDEELLLHFTTEDAKNLWIAATKEEAKRSITAPVAAVSSFGVSLSTLGPLKSLWLYEEAERLLMAAKKKKKEASEALKLEKREAKRRTREETKNIVRKKDGKVVGKTKMVKLNSHDDIDNDRPRSIGEEDLVFELSSDDEVNLINDGTYNDFDDNDVLIIDVDDEDKSSDNGMSINTGEGNDISSSRYPTSPSIIHSGSGVEGGGGLKSIGKENIHVNRVTIIIDDDDDDNKDKDNDDDDAIEETEVFEVDDESSADEGDDDNDNYSAFNSAAGTSLGGDDGDDSLPLPLVDRLKRRLQKSPSSLSPSSSSSSCGLCFSPVLSRQKEPFIACKGCSTHFHLFCAADHFLAQQRRIIKRNTLSTSMASSPLAASNPIVPSDVPVPCPGLIMIREDDNKGADKANDSRYRTSSCLSSLTWSQAIVNASTSSSLTSPLPTGPSDVSAAGFQDQDLPISTSRRKSITLLINKNK